MRWTFVWACLALGCVLLGCRSPQAVQKSISLAEYPSLELPLNLRMTNPEQLPNWKQHPISKATGALFGRPGNGYAIGKVNRNPEVILCATYFEASGQVVLSTHGSAGKLLDELTLSQDAGEGQVGYGGSLSPKFKIYRLEMFYVTDERSGNQRPEADHEDVFLVNERGEFVVSER